ncbi:MITOTIC CHECKPOINT PROTEIN BUB3.3 [Salix purpurea]|uniref:MITOTIC CHECKPOINT PROTEIN BUB3.3 n=1 Tax=Salix purpurea TaxID=77065 RepID=A0A9Q0Z230_SALPP|nr:MITOTIC CHECKPOINT PROTEIN BUB3.3 [Salix purpurea]
MHFPGSNSPLNPTTSSFLLGIPNFDYTILSPWHFTAASNGSIIRYDLHSGTNDAIGNHQDIATCVAYSIETCHVISAGLDKKVMSWDVRMANPLMLFRNLGAEIESISVSGFDLMVAVGAAVNIYDLRNFERAVDLKESSMDVGIRCVASTSYTRGYAIGSIDGRVAVEISDPFNLNSIRYTFRCHPKTKGGKEHLVSVNDIAFNPLIGGTFVTGDNEGYVTAWDAHSKRKLHEFPRYPNSVASLSYNHVGQLLAVASSYSYQEANESEVPPQIFIQKMDGSYIGHSPEVSRDSSRK